MFHKSTIYIAACNVHVNVRQIVGSVQIWICLRKYIDVLISYTLSAYESEEHIHQNM